MQHVPDPTTHLYTSITGVMVSLERIADTLCIGHYYPEAKMGPGYMRADGIAGQNAISALTTGLEQGYPVTIGERGQKLLEKNLKAPVAPLNIKSAPMDKAQQARVIELAGLLGNGLGMKGKTEQLEWLTHTLKRPIISRKQITEADMLPIRRAVVASRRVLEGNAFARFEGVGV